MTADKSPGNSNDQDTTLQRLCTETLDRFSATTLRWIKMPRDMVFNEAKARVLARHLMRYGTGESYRHGAQILEALGDKDLAVLLPLHQDALQRFRSTCLWFAAPDVTPAGLTVIANALRGGDAEAIRLAEKINKTLAAYAA